MPCASPRLHRHRDQIVGNILSKEIGAMLIDAFARAAKRNESPQE